MGCTTDDAKLKRGRPANGMAAEEDEAGVGLFMADGVERIDAGGPAGG
jgi:hypothetical protein